MADVGGLLVPLVTPFDARGEVDLDALERLAVEVLDQGTEGNEPTARSGACRGPRARWLRRGARVLAQTARVPQHLAGGCDELPGLGIGYRT